MDELVRTVEQWFAARCNGDWEHEFGLRIETTDNPGWLALWDLPLGWSDAPATLRRAAEQHGVEVDVRPGTAGGGASASFRHAVIYAAGTDGLRRLMMALGAALSAEGCL